MSQWVRVLLLAYLLLINLTSTALAGLMMPRKPYFLNQSLQLIVVVTDSWESNQGIMHLFVRENPHQNWHNLDSPKSVLIGKNGLAWGGDYKEYAGQDPVKKEGDHKAPAGAFPLASVFGFSPTADNSAKFPYFSITPSTVCVDDPQSKYYGQIIDSAVIRNKDWNSAESMASHSVYKNGIVVDYNLNGQMPEAGSCIFIHHKGNPQGTEGCTAMESSDLEKLINWLDFKANPALVKLPKSEYTKLQEAWDLPRIAIEGHIR